MPFAAFRDAAANLSVAPPRFEAHESYVTNMKVVSHPVWSGGGSHTALTMLAFLCSNCAALSI